MDGSRLREWLTARVAAAAGIPSSEVIVQDATFHDHGLDSAEMLAIAGDLEALLGRRVEADALFAHPTVAALAAHLTAPAGDTVRAAAASSELHAPVAIVGIACRFPGAPSTAHFWQLLESGLDAVGEIPDTRWPAGSVDVEASARFGAFLADVEGFDNGFFRVPRDEAIRIDPQQRMLLEVAWECFEDAGVPPERLRGSRTGVYVGISTNEYGRRQLVDVAALSPVTPTANALSIAANRVSYVYDLRGPSIAVDTACSSSLVALHLAVRALRALDSDAALVCGVNLLLEPEISIALEKAGMLSADGRCKTFDARADGYVRGEGCGAVMLKPLARAVADGDRIYAVVRGTAVNQDGRSNGLTAPNPDAQKDVLRAAYADAGVSPNAVQYVECHGTGTFLGDPLEAKALGAVVGVNRDPGHECLIGSVKTNVGHLESAAGVAGLIKTALALHFGQLPGSLHFSEANPHIPFADIGLSVATAHRPWPESGDPERLAGVSSFGFGGTNAHAVLASAPAAPVSPTPVRSLQGPFLLPVSARTEAALFANSRALADSLRERASVDGRELNAILHTATARRTHHPVRVAVVGDTLVELASRLGERSATGSSAAPGDPATGSIRSARRVGFVFSGQGSQWAGMARGLLESEPLFRSTIARCDEAIEDLSDWTITEMLTTGSVRSLEDTAVAQPVLFAVQAGLVAVWRSYGVEPVAVVGHSVGELAAAYAARALRLDEAARLAFRRGQAMASTKGNGRMLAFGGSETDANPIVARYAGLVDIAAVNGPGAIVLAGDVRALREVEAECDAEGRFARWLPVKYAFHSYQMDEAARSFAAQLGSLRCEKPELPFYSTVRGRLVNGDLSTAEYWAENVRGTVRFANAVAAMLDDGVDALVEIGPEPVLQTPIKRLQQERERQVPSFGSLRRGQDDRRALLATAAGLYEAGVDLAWHRLAPPARVVSLPTYQWQHERLWFERRAVRQAAPGGHPLLGQRLELAAKGAAMVWESEVSTNSPAMLIDHRILGAAVMPASGFVEIAVAAARGAGLPTAVTLADLSLHTFLTLSDEPVRIQTTAKPESAGGLRVEIHARAASHDHWTLHATCQAVAAEDTADGPGTARWFDLGDAQFRCLEQLPPALFYRALAERGLDYGPEFRAVRGVWRGEGEAFGPINSGDPTYCLDPRLLDGALQLLAAAAGFGPDSEVRVPVGFESLTVWPEHLASAAAAHSELQTDGRAVGDVRILDAAGRVLAELRGLRALQPAGRPGAAAADSGRVWNYEVVWRPSDRQSLPARMDQQRFLIVPGNADTGLTAAVVDALQDAGAVVTVAEDGDYADLLRDLVAERRAPRSVVYLRGSDPAEDAGPGLACALVKDLAALVQAMSFSGGGAASELWVVTRGAQPVAGEPVTQTPAAAMLGICKAVPFENAAMQCRTIDLDPREEDAHVARVLLAELADPGDEAEVGFRNKARFVRRLATAAASSSATSGLELDPAATYLITGGLGALGLQVARWMAARGARRLALLGRRPPSDRSEASVRALVEAGVDVVVAGCDVSDRDSLAAALAAVRSHDAPLRGVIHAAGVLDDGPLLRMSSESFDRVLAPKVAGAWWLNELTAEDPLDWLVMFSSAASLLGSPGQSNYCAANFFLDSFVHGMQASRPGACSVNWGPWAGEGMAEDWNDEHTLSGAYALLALDDALATLERVIVEKRTQTLVLPFDLRNLVQFFPVGIGLPFFAEIVTEDLAVLRSTGRSSTPMSRPALDHEYVAPRNAIEEQIAAIWQTSLGIDRVGVNDGFFELGGDSVFGNQIVVEIDRALGVSIAAEEAFDDFTIAALAVLAEAAMVRMLEQVSDDDAARLLATLDGPAEPAG